MQYLPFYDGLVHLAQHPPGSSLFSQIIEFSSFSGLNSILL